MKQFVVAFACAALAAVAQAASTDWNWNQAVITQNGETGKSWSVSTEGKYSGNTSFAVRVTYTLPEGGSLNDDDNAIELFAFNYANSYWKLQTNPIEQIVFGRPSFAASFLSTLSVLMKDGKLTLMFEYDDAAQTIAVYIEDSCLTNATTSGVNIDSWLTFRAGGIDNAYPLDREFPEGTTYEFMLTTKPASDPGVPEPTVLALLALGIAGAALRRRVA